MIPEEYWRLIRRWYWLLGVFIVGGAIASMYFLPSLVGSGSTFDANATLGISHYISVNGAATTSAATVDDQVVADYTETLAAYAETPQFIASLRRELTTDGIYLRDKDIEDRLEVTANPPLFRIDLHARAGSRKMADAVVANASDVLIQRAKAEEERVTGGLVITLKDREKALMRRLQRLTETRQQVLESTLAEVGTTTFALRPESVELVNDVGFLMAGGSPKLDDELRRTIGLLAGALGNAELVLLDWKIVSAEDNLKALVDERQGVTFNPTKSSPALLINPTDTVKVQGSVLRKRDSLLLGALIGLLVGWGAVNMAERLRPAHGISLTGKSRARVH